METAVRIYNGPCPEVDIPLADAFETVNEETGEVELVHEIKAIHGEQTTMPLELAERLDIQGDWLLEDGTLPPSAVPPAERVYSVKDLRAVAKDLDISVPRGASKEDIEQLIDEHTRQQNEQHAEGESGGQPSETGDDQVSGEPDASTTAAAGE